MTKSSKGVDSPVSDDPKLVGDKPAVDDNKPKSERLTKLLSSELIEKLRKKNGDTILMRASDLKVINRPRIPTGIFQLDYGLGGGLPQGLTSIIYGNKSSGKTTTYLKAIKNAQNMCSTCHKFLSGEAWGCRCKKPRENVIAYLDVEGTLDIPWARTLGVDTDRMMISIPEYAEQALDIGEALLRSGEVDILVLDSIAFLTPQKEIEESIEKDMMGVQPRIVGRGIRKFTAAANGVGNETGRRPTVFFTNQIRMMLGVMFGNPETQPGGRAPGYAAAVEIKLTPGKYDMDESSKKPICVEIKYRIEKNKTAGAKMEGEFTLFTSNTPDKKMGEVADEMALIDHGERIGAIIRSGGYQCIGETFRVKADLEKRLIQDPVFKGKLWNTVMPLILAA